MNSEWKGRCIGKERRQAEHQNGRGGRSEIEKGDWISLSLN